MGVLSSAWDSLSGKNQISGAQEAGRLDREGIQKGQDYLIGRDEAGNRIGDQALEGLSSIYQGDMSGQQDMIDRAQNSPLYASIMGGRDAGEESILRNASATGGLRSGNASGALTDYGSQLENRALLESYNQQVSGLEGLTGQRDRNTAGIAGAYSDMGKSRANEAMAVSAGKDALLNNSLAIGSTVGSFFSDPRLKKDIKYIGDIKGNRVYQWTWNSFAKALGLKGKSIGVLAHEIPIEATGAKDGFLTVDYDMLGLNRTALNLIEV